MLPRRRQAFFAFFGAMLVYVCGTGIWAQTADIVDRSAPRVCADPNNLPFSDEKQEGFENKIANVMAGALGLKPDYTWLPHVIGFERITLHAHSCAYVI